MGGRDRNNRGVPTAPWSWGLDWAKQQTGAGRAEFSVMGKVFFSIFQGNAAATIMPVVDFYLR
jgi:hypothetical protein